MPPGLEERRPAITPQLAVRVAVLGGIAFVAFAIIFFRLWFLQVLTRPTAELTASAAGGTEATP